MHARTGLTAVGPCLRRCALCQARAAEEDGGEGAMEEGDEDIQQPTEEQLFVGRPSGARKRPAEGPPGDEEEEEEEEELGEAPPRPMRRRR
eukprot:jgi/Tetstr1/424139/TSEL_014747.t1